MKHIKDLALERLRNLSRDPGPQVDGPALHVAAALRAESSPTLDGHEPQPLQVFVDLDEVVSVRNAERLPERSSAVAPLRFR
jgi:hypothetical protein